MYVSRIIIKGGSSQEPDLLGVVTSLLLVQGEIYPMESGDGAEDALMGREYLELDRQLDQLDAALTVLEGRREQLHREAKQLLVDAKAAREQSSEEEDSKEPCHQEDQTQNGSAEK